MGLLDLFSGMGQAGAAPWFERLTSGLKPEDSGLGGLGEGGLQGFLKQENVQDLLKQLMQPQEGAQAGAQAAPLSQPAQGQGASTGDLSGLIQQYLQQMQRR